MALVNHGGKLLLQNGALATGAACCCNKCSGPCPNGVSDCAPGCACVNGECVSPCCINGALDSSYTSQESCEDCTTTNTCSEYMYLEDPEASCPEGWTSDGWGGCSRTTNPASCESCSGYCYSEQSGPCGVWLTGDILERTNPCAPCDNSCIGVCELPPQELYYEDVNTLNVDAKTGARTLWNSTFTPATAPWQFRPGYPAAACIYYQLNDGVAYSTWVNGIDYSYSEAQVRLLAIDCEQGDLVDVTGKHTFGGAIKSYGCVVGNFGAPVAECLAALQVPALKPQPIPQLICPP